MTDFYADARQWRIGLEQLLPEQEEITGEWVEYCERAHVLTKQIYKLMSREEQRKVIRGTAVFVTRGGIEVKSMGAADRFFESLKDRWQLVAKMRARELRKAAGWTDEKGRNDYLVDPEGGTLLPNGQRYGPYAAPGEYYDLGPWDGEITADVKFTV